MTLETLAGHTVCLDALPEYPTVLDVGCRGFDFTSEVLRLRPHARIIALDPDPEISDPRIPGVTFVNKALVHDDREVARYASYSTGEGNFLTDAEAYYDANMLSVPCINIRWLMAIHEVKYWNLVKLDCEGSELDILYNWPNWIAAQISVEFHDGHPEEHGEHRVKGDKRISEILEHLSNYRIVQHPLFKQGSWFGHWDSLLMV